MSKLSIIAEVLKAREICDTESLEALLDLETPNPDPKEMGQKFTDVIGYNPIIYHNEALLDEMIGKAIDMVSAYPETLSQLTQSTDYIKKSVLDDIEANRAPHVFDTMEGYLAKVLKSSDEISGGDVKDIMSKLQLIYSGYPTIRSDDMLSDEDEYELPDSDDEDDSSDEFEMED